MYNGKVSMASKNIAGVLTNFEGTRDVNIFKMSGQMYHLTPSHIFPKGDQQPKFSQIYVYDQDNEADNRHSSRRAKGGQLFRATVQVSSTSVRGKRRKESSNGL